MRINSRCKVKRKMIETGQAQEEREAHEQDCIGEIEERTHEEVRISRIEQEIDRLEAKFNEIIDKFLQVIAKFDALGKRMTKMEYQTYLKQEEKAEDLFGEIADIVAHNRSFDDGWDEMEKDIIRKQNNRRNRMNYT